MTFLVGNKIKVLKETIPRFQVSGMIERGQKSKPQKIPRASNKMQKIPGPKLNLQKIPCQISNP